MNEKCLHHIYCVCCFGCILTLNIVIFMFNFLLCIKDILWTLCIGIYYLLICIVYLGLFSLIVKNSFDHVEQIILHKMSNEIKNFDSKRKSKNTEKIFKHILLNLTFISFSIILNFYFDVTIVKLPLVLYVCWTMGFTACFPINKDLSIKLNNNQIKDYILSKSLLNTLIFISLFYVARQFLN